MAEVKELTLDEVLAENAELRKKAERLESAIKTGKETGVVSMPVPGSFKAEWADAKGKKMKSVVEFKDGRLRVILPKIEGLEQQAGMYVASESLLRIANGEAPLPEHCEQNPALNLLTKETAAAVLTHFAGIKAGFLKGN